MHSFKAVLIAFLVTLWLNWRHKYREHALQAQYNSWQDRKISFYWHMAWRQHHLTAVHFTVVLLKLSHLITCNVSALVWIAPCAEAKWSVHLKSLPFDVVVKIFCVYINAILVKKKEMEAAVVSRVANPSPAPALNIFNTVKLVSALILTAYSVCVYVWIVLNK